MSNENCFFKQDKLADGKPYVYRMHKTGKMVGGSYPMASISFNTVTVKIPRSKVARNIHLVGVAVKIFSVIILPFLMYGLFQLNNQPEYLLIFLILGLFLGYFLVRIIYRFYSVKPKFRYAGTYHKVREYKNKGYVRGAHAMISTTPFGIVYHLAKWIL